MSLIHWQPRKELDTLRQQINRLFDDLMHGKSNTEQILKFEDTLWIPAVEVKETNTAVILKAVVPGIDAKELDVQVSETSVAIAGEHEEEKRTEEQGYFTSELHYGRFHRVIPLPVPVKHEQVQAEFKAGILLLTLPKAESSHGNTTKVDLTSQEQAREAATHHRHHDQHVTEAMRTRASGQQSMPSNSVTAAAREHVAKDRQHTEHLHETMQERAAESIN